MLKVFGFYVLSKEEYVEKFVKNFIESNQLLLKEIRKELSRGKKYPKDETETRCIWCGYVQPASNKCCTECGALIQSLFTSEQLEAMGVGKDEKE